MLMQPRSHFPHSFGPGDSSSSSTFFDSQLYPAATDSSAPGLGQNSYLFSDPFAATPTLLFPQNSGMGADAYQAAAQSVGQQNQHAQWPVYGDASQQAARMSQSSQGSRKRFRPNDRSFSNDINKSPSAYSQHLPTPTHTPTQPAFLDSTFMNSNKGATSAAMGLNAALDQHYDDLPGYAHSTGHSVSSYGHDSPATPRTMNGEDQGETAFDALYPFSDEYSQIDLDLPNVPKFERTISDIYADELFNPNSFTSHPGAKYAPTNPSLLSPYHRNSINERLQAANQARSVSPIDPTQRRPSPFRQGSPYAAPVDFGSSSHGHIGTAAGVRQQQKREADERAYQQHHSQPNTSEPATISPKDAVLDYHETPDDMDTPLYPSGSASDSMQQSYAPMNNARSQYSAPSGSFSFIPPSLPSGSSGEIPLFLTNQFRPSSSGNSMPDGTPDFPAHLISMETSASASDTGADNFESSQGSTFAANDKSKPSNTSAGRGVYACTWPGCTDRFETGAKLQKHRRDSHRPSPAHQPPPQNSAGSSPSSSAADAEDGDADGRIGSAMTSAALMQRNAQAGPHRCGRVNPSTGKPCNTIFSRPYDLTRHEDTIHNGRQKKVRCALCTEDKTFSRSDALTRHMRVVHPEVDFPGKHRRRHVS